MSSLGAGCPLHAYAGLYCGLRGFRWGGRPTRLSLLLVVYLSSVAISVCSSRNASLL